MRFQLFIDEQVVDLFQDESIKLTRKVKDFNDVSKVFSDFSQSFMIPASDHNNKILSHWWNIDLVDGFDANKKVDAHIEIDSIRVFKGCIEVVDVLFENLEPKQYSVAFYGDVKNLSTTMGEDTLQDLDTDAFNHERTSANIVNSWSGNLLSGKVVYPVISWQDVFKYGHSTGDERDINDGTESFDVADLKPALLLTELVKKCFTNYGYTSQGDFYTDTFFDDMFVCPSAYAGKLNSVQVEALFKAERNAYQIPASNQYWQQTYTTEYKDHTNSLNISSGNFTAPASGTYSLRAEVYIGTFSSGQNLQVAFFKNGSIVGSASTYTSTGAKVKTQNVTLATGDILTLRFQSNASGLQTQNIVFECTSAPDASSDKSINFAELMPQIKVKDFLSQVAKTFNLVFVPISDTRIDVEMLQEWYEDGQYVDYSKYADLSTIKHKKVPVPNSVQFKHKEVEDFVSDAFKRSMTRDYGSVMSATSVDFGSGDLKVESPFTIIPPYYLDKFNSNGLKTGVSDVPLYQMIDNDNSAVMIPLFLFYYNGLSNVSDNWKFGGTNRTQFPVITPYSAYPTTSTSNSCAFSLESALDGDAPEDTLLDKSWLKYISRLFSPKSRIVEMQLHLPVGEWINMELNQTVNIHGRYFKIDSIEYDLLENKANVVLMTYPDVTIWSASSSGNSWVITPAMLTNTYIGTGGQGNVLGNVTTVNGTTSTTSPNSTLEYDYGDGAEGGIA